MIALLEDSLKYCGALTAPMLTFWLPRVLSTALLNETRDLVKIIRACSSLCVSGGAGNNESPSWMYHAPRPSLWVYSA